MFNRSIFVLTGVAFVCAAAVAQAHERFYVAFLSGANQIPPNPSAGTGISWITLDLDLITMRVQVDFQGLSGAASACNMHGPTVVASQGVAGIMIPAPGFANFPLGETSGSYDYTYDLTSADSYDQTFIASSGGTVGQALNRLIFALEDGKVYVNLASSALEGGEIRGFYNAPCAADFNHDNAADFFDYLDFVDAFSSVLESADFNHDETIDFFDYLDFVDAFATGC